MFCQSCGTKLPDNSAICAACGFQPQAPAGGVAVAAQVKTSSRDALAVLKRLAVDPVGGLPEAFLSLGAERALSAGIALCVIFALAASAGVVIGADQVQRLAGSFLGPFGGFMELPQGLGGFLKTALQLLVLPAAITVVGLALRKMSGATPPISADIFTAGAALAPLGVASLLTGLIGVGNVEIAALLLYFALAYLVLMLYSGFTGIGGMTSRAGAPAVPGAILLSGWLCKVVIAAFV